LARTALPKGCGWKGWAALRATGDGEGGRHDHAVSHVTVRVLLTIRRRPGRKTLVSLGFGADGGRIATKADPALLGGAPGGWSDQREHPFPGAPTRLTERDVRIAT
jgi:hypothetical protein